MVFSKGGLMKIGVLFLVFLLVGCMTNQKYDDTASKQSTNPRVDVTWSKIKIDTVIPGRTYHFDDTEPAYSVEAQTVEKVKIIVRKKMTELGYEEVKARRKAYVSIYFVADWEKLADDDVTSVKTTTSRIENGKVVSQFSTDAKRLARFTLAVFTNTYGKRFTEVSRLFLKAPEAEWNGFEDQLLFSIERDFHGLIKAAPQVNQKMAGDPGCMPRFGYFSDRITEKVIKVSKKSPADRAGIRVGDQILAIDSLPPNEGLKSNQLYEDAVNVPVKFKRGDQILRAKMKPELICE